MLKVSGLRVERSGHPLFAALSFSLQPGQLFQVRGINGSGKTTLLRTLMGLYSEYEGSIEWDLDRPPVFLGHRAALSDRLTVLENLAWLCRLQDTPVAEAQLEDALAQVELQGYEDTPCGQLSAGQRRRVALALLFVSTNPCWILDEPFSSLDTDGCAAVEELLSTHIDNGGAVILTSHQALNRVGVAGTLELQT